MFARPQLMMEMKIAAAQGASQTLAREDVPEEVSGRLPWGPADAVSAVEYIIPAPFDPRLIHYGARRPWPVAAMNTGVARKPDYRREAAYAAQSWRRGAIPVAGLACSISSTR